MSKMYFATIALVLFCFSSTAYSFNAEKESHKVIQLIKNNDVVGVYKLSARYKKDEKEVKSLKSFQKDQKREEFIKQYQYDNKLFFEILNNNAKVKYIEYEKKKLRNGKTDYTVYYTLSYDNKDDAGLDYNKKIKKCVIAIGFSGNMFNSLSIMNNPAPEYW